MGQTVRKCCRVVRNAVKMSLMVPLILTFTGIALVRKTHEDRRKDRKRR